MAVEQRDVRDFNQVVMEDIGRLAITQGEQESLTVETDLDLRDVYTEVRDGVLILRLGRTLLERLSVALESGFGSQRVHYRLSVKQLHALTVAGAGRVECAGLDTDKLELKLAGVGDIEFQALSAQELNVVLSGSGQVRADGKAERLQVRLSGVGSYAGAGLQSQQAWVHLSGMGKASVWAERDLDVHLSGMGSLEYRGNPRMKRRVSGLGSITHVGEQGQHTTESGPGRGPRPPQAPRPPFGGGAGH